MHFETTLPEGSLKKKIRDLGERLDAHRKRQQALHPALTLAGLYNVLDLLRAGTPLDAKAKAIHDHGLVSLLRQLHDELDTAVLEAYGWTDLIAPVPLADRLHPTCPDSESLEQTLLTRLVALNHERAAEEKRGLIRWLRPDYQAPATAQPTPTANEQEEINLPATTSTKPPAPTEKLPWPETLTAQVTTLQKLLPTHGPDPETLSALFGKKTPKRTQQITDILETLRALGQL